MRCMYLVIESEEEGFSDEDDTEVVRNRPMTKRQRAKVYQEIPEEYLELPMGKYNMKASACSQLLICVHYYNDRFW